MRPWKLALVPVLSVLALLAPQVAEAQAIGGVPEHRDTIGGGPFLGTVTCSWSGSTISADYPGGPVDYVMDVHSRWTVSPSDCTLGSPPLATPIILAVQVEQTSGLDCSFYVCNWFDPNVRWFQIDSAAGSEYLKPRADYALGRSTRSVANSRWVGLRVRYTVANFAVGSSVDVQSYPILVAA